ncbi:glycosyltransferase family 2 protein [Cobetia sp. 4B]|uniref:glycosyltransferase family 2 protein n=1 Tax=Cobetia sp. 4B TaxID=2758724 RepID=UPI001C04B166|nr:glycosyltransferase family A protein [Cobetia sp. 4B]QWN35858.1 glycosyltransferase family 2 protein [Cobetia sp. 4B]
MRKLDKNLVSVIIPTYNRESLVIDSLNSILEQSYRPIEIVLVDDGSTDNTVSVVRKWRNRIGDHTDFTVNIVQQSNLGAPSARNLGIKKSKGRYIQFFDSDDLLDAKKIDIQVSYLKNNLNIDYVYARAQIFENVIGDTDKFIGSERSGTIAGHMGAHALKTDLGIYRRRIIEKMGFWNENMKVWQEGEYNLRLFTNKANIHYMPEVLAYYRIHNNGRISSNISEYKFIDSLKSTEETAVRGLERHELRDFYDALTSRYYSIFKHSVESQSPHVAFKAARKSFIPAIRAHNLGKIFKSTVLILLCATLPVSINRLLLRKFR